MQLVVSRVFKGLCEDLHFGTVLANVLRFFTIRSLKIIIEECYFKTRIIYFPPLQ